MRLEHVVRVLGAVVGDSNVTFLTSWGDKDGLVLAIWVQSTKTFRIVAGVNGVNESKISEVVHIYSILQHNNYLVFAELDRHHSGLE